MIARSDAPAGAGVDTADTATATATGPAPRRRRQVREHLLYVDLVRVLTIGLVISVHTISAAGTPSAFAAGALVTVLHVSREVFFILTAFVLTYGYASRPTVHWPTFWRRRYLFVAVPYLAWSAIYCAAGTDSVAPGDSALGRFGHELVHGTACYHLYFLLVSMQLYLVFPLLRRLLHATRRHHGALLAVAVGFQLLVYTAVSARWSPGGPVGVWLRGPNPWLPSYLGFVVVGAVAASHLDQLTSWTGRHLRTVGAGCVAAVGLGVGVYLVRALAEGKSTTAASTVFQPVTVLESLAITWAFLAAGLLWVRRGAPGRRLVLATSDASFGVYLAHPLLLQGAAWLSSAVGLSAVTARSRYGVALVVLLVVVVPVIYGSAVLLTAAARRTHASLALTGRTRLVRAPSSRPAAGG